MGVSPWGNKLRVCTVLRTDQDKKDHTDRLCRSWRTTYFENVWESQPRSDYKCEQIRHESEGGSVKEGGKGYRKTKKVRGT